MTIYRGIYCPHCESLNDSDQWEAWHHFPYDAGDFRDMIKCPECGKKSETNFDFFPDAEWKLERYWDERGVEIISEPTPEPTPEPTLEPIQEEYIVVSDNEIDYTEQINKIIDNQERIIRQNERLIYHTVSNCNVARNAIDNQIVSMNGIFNKKINDYNVQEGLLLLMFVMFAGFALISVIRKGIFKWK